MRHSWAVEVAAAAAVAVQGVTVMASATAATVEVPAGSCCEWTTCRHPRLWRYATR